MWQVRTAVLAAKRSNSPRYRVGAAAFKGSRCIGHTSNKFRKVKREYRSTGRGCAELRLSSCTDLAGSTVFVVRLNDSGELRMSKPCFLCECLLRSLGCKRVVFSNTLGELEEDRYE